MNKYVEQLQDELESSESLPYFEISVTRDGKEDWITCHLFFKGNSLIAERASVSTKEENSKYIASDRMTVDSCLTLDEHLQEMYEKVCASIQEGDLYTLAQ